MKNNKKVFVVVGIIVAVILLVSTASYALFMINVTENNNFSVKIENLKLTINDAEDQDTINLGDLLPKSEEKANLEDGYTFTITNSGTINSYYTVYLDEVEPTLGEKINSNMMRFNLQKNNGSIGTSKVFGDYSNETRILDTGYLEPNQENTYTLRIWLDYDATNAEQGKYFSTKIRVVGKQVNEVAYKEDILNGADPVLADNLIPVRIDDNGTVHKADINKEWYNYANKEWANAIIQRNSYDILNEEGKVSGAIKQDGGVYFDGVNDYIDLGLENYDFRNSITLAVRLKINKIQKQEFIGNLEGAGCSIFMRSNGEIVFQFFNNNISDYIRIASSALLDTNNIHTFVGTYDGNVAKLYVDGTMVSSIQSVGTIKTSTVPYCLAANPGPDVNSYGDFANSTYYEATIFDRVLSEEEIAKNYSEEFILQDTTDLLSYQNFTDEYSNNETILEDNIESYFVWIPKYSYQIWDLGLYNSTIDGTPTESNAREIQIRFGLNETEDKTGECKNSQVSGGGSNCHVGDWITHPAFSAFGTNGLWVGKFETGYKGANNKEEAQITSDDSTKIIIKPNVYSWRNNTAYNMFVSSYNYNRTLDSHMMKNTEWGAVTYLSHSKYGINNEVNINNNSSYKTGYSAIISPTCYTSSSSDCNQYGTTSDKTKPWNTATGHKASTTGNITGIYDMSGGAHEYVASYIDGNYGNSGYSENPTSVAGHAKYFDIYNTSSSTTTYNYRILGDATGEMGAFNNYQDGDENARNHNWYGDASYFVSSSYPWFCRGGIYYYGVLSGQFYFLRHTGGVSTSLGSRLILAP